MQQAITKGIEFFHKNEVEHNSTGGVGRVDVDDKRLNVSVANGSTFNFPDKLVLILSTQGHTVPLEEYMYVDKQTKEHRLLHKNASNQYTTIENNFDFDLIDFRAKSDETDRKAMLVVLNKDRTNGDDRVLANRICTSIENHREKLV